MLNATPAYLVVRARCARAQFANRDLGQEQADLGDDLLLSVHCRSPFPAAPGGGRRRLRRRRRALELAAAGHIVLREGTRKRAATRVASGRSAPGPRRGSRSAGRVPRRAAVTREDVRGGRRLGPAARRPRYRASPRRRRGSPAPTSEKPRCGGRASNDRREGSGRRAAICLGPGGPPPDRTHARRTRRSRRPTSRISPADPSSPRGQPPTAKCPARSVMAWTPRGSCERTPPRPRRRGVHSTRNDASRPPPKNASYTFGKAASGRLGITSGGSVNGRGVMTLLNASRSASTRRSTSRTRQVSTRSAASKHVSIAALTPEAPRRGGS